MIRRYSETGGPIPSNVRAQIITNENEIAESHEATFGLMRGTIQRAVYPEEDENQSGSLEYIVTIAGQDYYAVRDMTTSGGIFNNRVRVRQGVVNSVEGLDKSTFEEKKDGENVWCLFINGDGDVPIIVAGADHPRVEENPDYVKPSAALGAFDRDEFNGIEFLIDKDGTWTMTQVGLKDPMTGQPKNPTAVGSKVSFTKDGDFDVTTAGGTNVNVSNADDAVTITCADTDSLELSKANGFQISTPAGGGTSLSMKSGKVDVTAAKDITVTSSGAKVTVAGATEVSIGDATGGKVKVAGGQIAIGNATAELLDLVSQVITKLSTATAPGFGSPISIVADMLALIPKITAIKGSL